VDHSIDFHGAANGETIGISSTAKQETAMVLFDAEATVIHSF
tara:strand:- start:310 stop:435 length:126 start_codon:yes stop_codon:yes gene_type:complete